MIEDYAFAYQRSITKLEIPESIRSIGKYAFMSMRGLEAAVWPATVTILSEGAFTNCSSLTEIQLPDTLEQIRKDAFARTNLQTITLPAGLTRIDVTALSGCNALQRIQVKAGSRFYESRDGVLYDIADSMLVKYPAAKSGDSYTVSDAITIGKWAFENAASLKTIVLSENVWFLEQGAFSGCTGLTELPKLSSMITKLPANCFSSCAGLKDIVLPASVKELGDSAFAGCHPGTITVSDKLTAIGARAIDKDTIVYGSSDCYAKSWCMDNGLVFRAIGTIAPQSLFAENMTLQRGDRQQLVVTAEPSDADLSQLTITVVNPSVAYVDETGVGASYYEIVYDRTIVFHKK